MHYLVNVASKTLLVDSTFPYSYQLSREYLSLLIWYYYVMDWKIIDVNYATYSKWASIEIKLSCENDCTKFAIVDRPKPIKSSIYSEVYYAW